jgi:hypothetical protein
MPFGQTGFRKEALSKSSRFCGLMALNRHINIINHATRVIDVFFAGRVGRQKGLRSSAWVSRLIENQRLHFLVCVSVAN